MYLPFFTRIFLTQFERHGTDWLYRESSRSAPKFVTTAEKDQMARVYGRWIPLIIIGALLTVMAATAIMYAIAPHNETLGLIVGFLAFGTYLAVTIRWVMFAPSRALVNRPPLGPTRTRAEVVALVQQRQRETGSPWG